MNKVIDTIKEKLIEIEKRENIKILHCVESGSRAWGFPSSDSRLFFQKFKAPVL